MVVVLDQGATKLLTEPGGKKLSISRQALEVGRMAKDMYRTSSCLLCLRIDAQSTETIGRQHTQSLCYRKLVQIRNIFISRSRPMHRTCRMLRKLKIVTIRGLPNARGCHRAVIGSAILRVNCSTARPRSLESPQLICFTPV